MSKTLSYRDFDWVLFAIALAIAAIGVAQIHGTTAHTIFASQYRKQIYWVALGCILALAVSRVDYHVILEHVPWIYVLSILALGAVLLAGHSSGGARPWLRPRPARFPMSGIVEVGIIRIAGLYIWRH